eukprot:symbB.v1.2.009285.t1/scaffold571.1/size186967/3
MRRIHLANRIRSMAPFMTSTETNRPFDRKDPTSREEWSALEVQLLGDWEARRQAVQALGRGKLAEGSRPGHALELVTKYLDDEDQHVRRTALEAAVRLSLPPPPHEDMTTEEAAAATERRQRAQESEVMQNLLQQVMLRLAEDQDWGVRKVALSAVAEMATRGHLKALQAVQVYLSDKDDDVRGAAAVAIGKLAPRGEEEWLQKLFQLLEDDDEGVRQAAVTAVGRVAPKGHGEAIHRLRDLAHDEDDDKVRRVELYGFSNINTGEWTDGLVALLVREAVSDTSDNKKWVLFDGPVDAIWIENMNTVLDDNKMLCLANGERIKLPPTMTMMFEVQDLKVASPATISRCGMVWESQPFHTHRGLSNRLLEKRATQILDINGGLKPPKSSIKK